MTSGRDFRRSASADYTKPAPYDAYDKEGEEEREKDQVRLATACERLSVGRPAFDRSRLHGLPATTLNVEPSMGQGGRVR